MASAQYDITAQQYAPFIFHAEYLGTTGAGINLSEYTSRFHVRANTDSNAKFLEITTSGVTTGGSTGEFVTGSTTKAGLSGSGKIYHNTGETGGSLTGGILITVDATSMGYVRSGSWQYSLDVTKGTTTDELLTGRFIVLPKITR